MKWVHDIVEQEMLSCFTNIMLYTFPNTDIIKKVFFGYFA